IAGIGLAGAAATQSDDANAMPARIVDRVAELLANAPVAVRNAPKEQQDKWLKSQGAKDIEIAGHTIDAPVSQDPIYFEISPQGEARVPKEGSLARPWDNRDWQAAPGYFEHTYDSSAISPNAVILDGDHWGGDSAFHVRGHDDEATGTRKVYEIQSDAQNMHGMEYRQAIVDTAGEIFNEARNNPSMLPADFTQEHKNALEIIGRGKSKADFAGDGRIYDEVLSEVKKAASQLHHMTYESPSAFVKGFNWEENAINRQFVEASNKGLKQVDFLITTGDDSMKRSDKVEQRYQTTYRKQIEKQAAKIGAKVEEVNEVKGASDASGASKPSTNTYLRVVLPASFTVPAFAHDQEDPDTKMADLVANMVQSGEMSMDEAYSVLQTNAPDIADKVLAPALQAHKQSLRAQGMNPWSVAKEMETKYNQPMNIQQMFTPDMPPEAIIQAIEKVNEQPWAQAKEIGSLVSDEARVAIKEHAHQLASVIAAGLQDRGFEVRATDDGDGGVLVEYKDKNTGQWKVADANSSRDFSGAGALAGAGAGALAGGAVAGPAGALGGAALGAGAGYLAGGSVDPLAASAFQVGGGLAAGSAAFRAAGALVPPAGLPGIAAKAGLTAIGTGLGAMAGSTVDHLAAAAILKQQLDTKELLARAAEDGTTDAVLGLGVDTVLRGGAKMYQGIKKAITTARNAVDSYMLQGALKELENITGLTKAERLTLADKLEEVSQDAIARSEARREIEGVLQTRPGMEILVGEASRLSKTAGFGMLKEIDRRAKDVLNTADKMTADNISRVLVNELDSYKTAVKKSYEGIKMLGAREADSVGFQYNPNELGLPKLRNDMEGALANPSQISRFDSLWAKLEDIGAIRDEKGAIVDYVKNYGLAELLDTRRILTSFKSGNLDFGTIDKVNRVIANIDKEIDEAVKVMPNGEQWAEQFGQAKVEYSKMKALEENVMYKALTKDGISADDVVKTLSKYIKAEDGTFMKVLGKLPPAVRNNVEGAVIRNYANRYTVGDDQGFQAIDFPALARELDGVNFTTPGARDLKRVVDKLAKVYKNDPALAREAGALQMPKDKTYLATSMAGRIDMALHTELFNYVSRYLPTQRGRTRRLAEAISTVLDNPLNAKAVDHLTNELPKDPEMRTKLHQLAISYAERGQKETYPKVPLHKVYQNGYSQSTKATKYGEGIQYYTSKEAADAARTTGQRVEEVLVEPSRYATLEQASVIVGKKLTPAMLKQPRVVQQLKDLGYLGIADKDLVFEFK
ncbi:MAG: hypothetical protein JHC33_01145, partial [Ignisphaera sp.]|nr:hypothetical protein [Ignisphaera sp.]